MQIILDPAVFREASTEAVATRPTPASGGPAPNLSDISTAALEAELAARRTANAGGTGAEAAARAAFEREAKVLADYVLSSTPAKPIDYETQPGALPPVSPE